MVSQGTQLQVAVLPLVGQPLPVTWVGEMKMQFAPEIASLQLQNSRVHTVGAYWDYGSQLLDAGLPGEWFFPLRECGYGLLTIVCPNRPQQVTTRQSLY